MQSDALKSVRVVICTQRVADFRLIRRPVVSFVLGPSAKANTSQQKQLSLRIIVSKSQHISFP